MNLLNGKTNAKKKNKCRQPKPMQNILYVRCAPCAVQKRKARRPKAIANKERKKKEIQRNCYYVSLLFFFRLLIRLGFSVDSFAQNVTNKNNRCASQSIKVRQHTPSAHSRTQRSRIRIRGKNEWKNVFRIKVIKVNFYYMNIEYYTLFHHQPH